MSDLRSAMAAGHGISSLTCVAIQIRNAAKWLSDRDALNKALAELADQAERDIATMNGYINGTPEQAAEKFDAILARYATEKADERARADVVAREPMGAVEIKPEDRGRIWPASLSDHTESAIGKILGA